MPFGERRIIMTNSTFTFSIVAFILWAISATLLRFLKNEPILLKILGAIPGACGAILAILGVFQALPAPTIALLPCGKRDGCAILMLDCRVSFMDLYYTLSSPSSGSEWTRYDPDAPPHLEPGQPVHTYSQFLFFQSQIVYGGTVPPRSFALPSRFPLPVSDPYTESYSQTYSQASTHARALAGTHACPSSEAYPVTGQDGSLSR